MKIFNFIIKKIDDTTMYTVVISSLYLIIFISLILSFLEIIFFPLENMVLSLLLILFSSYIFHTIFTYIFKSPSNLQSTHITALILFLIFDPFLNTQEITPLIYLCFFGVATKYIISINNLHILNPAAISAVLVSVFGLTYATWWVGNPYLAPFVLLTGFLVAYKIRRFDLVLPAIFSATTVSFFTSYLSSEITFSYWLYSFFAIWPILFFVTFMLTEPLSTPGTKKQRIIYGTFVGGFSSLPYSFGLFVSSPELALVVGNLLVFPFMLKGRISASLLEKKEIGKNIYEFRFKKPKFLKFKSGQYLEWTLPHKNPDKRGISRYFTIASSPKENEIILGIRFSEKGSSFKKKMLDMKKGDKIYASSLSGDFLLPKKDTQKDLVFIAGGIGVTPFRSMVKDILESNRSNKIKMFFCNKNEESIVYEDVWKQAEKKVGMQVINLLEEDSKKAHEVGYINTDILKKYEVKNKDTIFYLSGPTAMVNSYKKLLISYGVSKKDIIKDYFPGLA